MKKIVILILLACAGFSKQSMAQEVKWHTFEEALELNKTEQRKIFIDVYTDWCGWCKKMEATTFSNPAIAKILNEKFYAVKFNAEQRNDIVYKGHTFKFVSSGNRGYHELAAALLNNKLSYPSIAFLFENNQPIVLPGYKTADALEPILMFLVNDAFLSQSFEEFQKSFKSQISPN